MPTVDGEIAALDTRLSDIPNEKGIEQSKIPNLEVELKPLKIIINKIKMDAEEVKRQNKLIAKKI